MVQLIRGPYNFKSEKLSCVASIGNFDGVHIGHQKLFAFLKDKAKEFRVPTLLIIFEPQPTEFFLKDKAAARLTRLREKLPLLAEQGIDYVLCLQFNDAFSHLSAESFIKEILLKHLDIQYLMVGDDFHFGHHREGDFDCLKTMGKATGFAVESMTTVNFERERISSTLIRQALKNGNMKKAEALLGRPYGMIGRVAHGHKRGRIIGFPTANIYLHREVSPVLGVYAVTVEGLDNKMYEGVANVGNRPTVDGTRTLLEVHIFDFHQEIYGHYLKVNFMHKLRDEKRYDNFDALKAQIFKDAQEAKEYFRK